MVLSIFKMCSSLLQPCFAETRHVSQRPVYRMQRAPQVGLQITHAVIQTHPSSRRSLPDSQTQSVSMSALLSTVTGRLFTPCPRLATDVHNIFDLFAISWSHFRLTFALTTGSFSGRQCSYRVGYLCYSGCSHGNPSESQRSLGCVFATILPVPHPSPSLSFPWA